MAQVVTSIEIARPPDEVFAYVTDPTRFSEWQESAVSANIQGGDPRVGARLVMQRRIGGVVRTFTLEITEFSPPKSWTFRGIEGPMIPNINVTVEPLDEGARSRVTFADSFEWHGTGESLVPMVVQQSRQTSPKTIQALKERLERGR
jgi:uncharacterized protein YndB with AHSA1/START domain